MFSVEVRPVQCALQTAAWLVVACMPPAGYAEADDDPFERVSAKIVAAQEAGGTYAAELIDPLTDLSLLYAESGDYALEAAVLERVVQVVRANFGLYSLEQARFIQQ